MLQKLGHLDFKFFHSSHNFNPCACIFQAQYFVNSWCDKKLLLKNLIYSRTKFWIIDNLTLFWPHCCFCWSRAGEGLMQTLILLVGVADCSAETVTQCFLHSAYFLYIVWNGILLPKLFWPTVRKHCSSDRKKLLKFETEGGKIFWDH